MRRTLLLCVLVLALVAASPCVQAHARPVTLAPEAGQRLDEPPTEVRIRFSEPINPRSTVIEVTDENGTRVDHGGPVIEQRRDAWVKVRINATDQGYLVRWSTYSTVDGHRMAGSWGFAIANGTPPQAFEDVRSPLAVSTVFARILAYAGLVLLVAVAWLCRSHEFRPPRIVNVNAAGVGLLFLGSAFLFLQSASATSDPFADAYARRVATQALLAVLAALTFGLAPGPVALAIRLLLVLGWAVVQGFSSHAAATAGTLGALTNALHLTSVVVWIGIVAALRLDPRESQEFQVNARLSSRVAAASAIGAITTGILLGLLLTVIAGRSPLALSTTYGLVFLYKMGAVAVLLGFGAVNQFVHLRRLQTDPSRFAPLRANLRRELVNAFIVLALAAILATLDPQIT